MIIDDLVASMQSLKRSWVEKPPTHEPPTHEPPTHEPPMHEPPHTSPEALSALILATFRSGPPPLQQARAAAN
jgi:hypothetical protein